MAAGLPPEWKVSWLSDDDAVAKGDGVLDLSDVPAGATSASLALFEEGLSPWGRSTFPVGAVTVQLRKLPRLDEIWCLWMLAARERGRTRQDAWETVARYADQIRQGLWPDRTRPEAAPQALYLAVAQERLEAEPPDRAAFLDEALALCEALATAVENGLRIGEDDLLRDEAWLAHYRTFLDSDQKLYRQERSRGTAYRATVPATPQQPARRLPLLVLRSPMSRLFKLWARTDPEAPGGDGYQLLLVELEPRRVVLSTDPTTRIDLSWLAHALNVVEEKVMPGPAEDPWYDGARHKRTLVASPKRGTALGLDRIIGVLRGELRLRRIHDRKLVRLVGVAVAAIAVTVVALVVAKVAQRDRSDRSRIAAEAHDAIYVLALGASDGKLYAHCTTFAVAPHTVATARHCFDKIPKDLTRAPYFIVQNDDPKVQRIGLGRVFLHDTADAALICVKSKLPHTLRIADDVESLAPGNEISVYGFPGVTQTQEALKTKQSEVFNAHFNSTVVSVVRKQGAFTIIEYTLENYAGVSGAPLLDDGARVVGVHRGVWQNTEGDHQLKTDEDRQPKTDSLSIAVRADALEVLLAKNPCEGN